MNEDRDNDTEDSIDMVGVSEIAHRLRLSTTAVNLWRSTKAQPVFPEPALRLAGGALWQWCDVLSWVKQYKPRHYRTEPDQRLSCLEMSEPES